MRRLFLRDFLGGFLFGFGGGFFGGGFGEGVVVFLPGFEHSLENSRDEFGGVGKISAAGAGHHHPCGDQGLADVAVSGGGVEIFEKGGGGGFFDG